MKHYYLENDKKVLFDKKHQKNFGSKVTSPKTLVLPNGTFIEYDLIEVYPNSKVWKEFRSGKIEKIEEEKKSGYECFDTMNYDPYIKEFFKRVSNMTLIEISKGLRVSYSAAWKMKNRTNEQTQYSKVKFFNKIETMGQDLYKGV